MSKKDRRQSTMSPNNLSNRKYVVYMVMGDRGSTVVKVAGSNPAGVIGFFIDIKSFRSHHGLG